MRFRGSFARGFALVWRRWPTTPVRTGCVKLSGQDAYRVRVGDYRIIYTIEDDKLIVLVIDVGHRRDVYRRR